MDNGLYNGLYTNTPEGVHNGIYTGTNNGVFNGVAQNKSIVKNGLVLWLDASRSDCYLPPYGNSQLAYDLTFKGNNCTANNTVTYSRNFNGIWTFLSSWYETVNNEILNLRIRGSYSIWINPNSLTQGTFAGFITRASNGGAGFVNSLVWRQDLGVIRGVIYNGTIINNVDVSLPTIVGIWYNYVFTWSGATLSLYRNGILVSTSQQTIIASNVSVPIRIGGRGVGGSSGGSEDFNGSIGEALIYNRALTRNEVMNNYISSKTRFNL
jgi:hypothetical protein